MSTRGPKKRGRPPKVQVAERNKKFQYHLLKKPKYLLNYQKKNDSQFSTPSASRANSPQETESRRISTRSRGHRAGKKSGATGSAYQRRNYNSVYDYHESEYHYGSDFGDDETDKSEIEDEVLSESDVDSVVGGGASSDSDFSLSSFSTLSGTPKKGNLTANRAPTPEPLWLQDRELPLLNLPKSSDDLLISHDHIMSALCIYEVLRHFRNLIRLSPFRFEDFCAAILCDDQSNLLSEIHIMLLKALLREEDSQQTHFGPLDQKDSVNIALYLIDNITYPEILRSYLESDKNFDYNVLHVLITTDYPFTNLENRIKVLQFLTDQFLITNPVREDLLSEVPMHYDDHCRVCHKLGDLLCCETCPAVYHLECVDPPLTIVPEEDWQCGICRSHKVSGVVDCVLDVEKQGQLSRQEPLGYDRHGRKYYFLCRRIFVESQEGEVWYYTTPLQYEELVYVLDKDDMEGHLYHQLEENKEEIIRQMELTQKLTKQYKGGKKTYLDAEQVLILQLIKEREEKEQESDKIINENRSEESNEVTESEKDVNECDDINESNKGIKLRSAISTAIRNIDDESRITRFKSNQIANGTYLFKLGMENSFKSYVNQFTTNIIALNKPQRNEERDKKRHLSHKFSLTPASEFKWVGGSNGTCALLTNTLKNTILQLEQVLPTPFMHPNWHLVRKHWLNIVGSCQKPRDFAKALIVLQACIKPVCFANVWHDQLGHTKLVRITAQEREERKKLEKREKKDREEEEERNRLIISSYIKYTMTFKHQLWKQKGEEYRMHGRWGWLWIRIPRCFRHVDSKKLGLSGDPQRFMLQIKDAIGQKKIVSLSPNMYRFLMNKLNKGEGNEKTNEENQEISEIDKKIEESFPDILKNIEILPLLNQFEEIDVSKALTTPGRLLYPKVAKKGVLDDLLGRRLQLKILEEKKIQSTTGEQQQQLKNEEEHHHHHEAEGDEEHHHSQQGEGVEKQLNNMLSGKMPVANSTPVNTEFLNSVAKKINTLRSLYSATSKIAKDFKCYSKGCNSGNSHQLENICYSPLCMQRIRLRRELLTLLRKANVSSAGNVSLKIHLTSQTASTARKTSILEQTLKAAPSSIRENETGNKSTDENFCKDLVDAVLTAESAEDESKLNVYVPVKENLLKQEIEMQKEEEKNVETKQECSDLKDEETTMDIDVTTMTPPKKKRKLNDENEDVDMSDLSPHTIKEMILGSKSNITKIVTTTTTTVTSSKSRDGKIKTLDASQKTKTSVTTQSANGVSSSIQSLKSKSATYVAKKNRRFCGYKIGVKREEKILKIERAEDGTERIYSKASTEGKIFLKKIPNQNELRRKKRTIVKYPICSNFKVRKGLHSLLVLPPHDARKLARNAGRIQSIGYNIMAKQNNLVWPYPCARPLFKTCWLYRTVNLKSLAAAALQLRILWATLRWDDMQTKPPNTDGKHQVTTETEILSLELLKHRHVGQFLERTQYLRRKVVIPLELPKTVREVTSIRSGLRKRKRPESPQSMDPQVSEEWVDEDKLELWEIKQYGEKIEKVQQVIVTRSRTGNLPPPRPGQNNSGDGLEQSGKIAVTNKAEEIKEKMEQQLRIQRAAHQQNKRSLEGKTLNVGSAQSTASTSTSSTSTTSLENSHSTNNNPTLKPIQPKVTTADGGTLKVMKNVVVPNQAVVSGKNTLTSLLTSNNRIGARRILMTKGPDGTTRVVPGNSSSTPTTTASKTTQQNLVKVQTGQQVVQSSAPVTTSSTTAAVAAASSTPIKEPQRVQIMRTPDGRITVKGLLPGQQLVQFPDGKLQVLTTTQLASAGASKITPTATSTPLKQSQILSSAVKSSTKVVSTASSGKQQQQQQQIVLTPKIPSSVDKSMSSTGQLLQKFNQQVVVGSNQVISTQGGQPVVTNQIVVNNPNLAQQLASGKVQVATVNGQQVLIRPTGNNQAQVIAQLTPGSLTQTLANNQIVQTTTTNSALKNTPTSSSSPQPAAPSPSENPSVNQSHHHQQDNQIDKATMEHLLIGQPPGTVIKCVTAQVIQTQQGPRIVLQGLQGADFTPQQLAAVQQQVKQQLLKAQASTGKQGVLGPTKIYLAVQPNLPETDGTVDGGGSESTDSNPPPPLAPVDSSKQQQQIASVRQQSQSSSVKQDDVETSGKVCQNLANGQQAQTSSALLQAMKTKLEINHKPQQQQQQQIVNNNESQQHQQFVVTPDYIQQTIKTALKQENLNPEIEEKLLQLQRFQERQMKQEPECVSPVPVNARKRVCSTSKNEDVDWVMEQPKRSRLSRNTTTEIRKVESIPTTQETPPPAVISEKISSSPLRVRAKSKEAERLSNNRAKIMVTLYRQKELLKKDILRKRALLEKDLQYEIQKEVADELAARTKIERTKQDEVRTSSSSSSGTSKKKSAGAPAATIPTISVAVTNKSGNHPPGRPGRKSKSQSFPHNKQNNQNKLKKEKVYCICRTPYDETKFYVGCDLCNNWFHGDCVGITEESSKSLSEFICDECKQARETQKLYCLCRQPYDDSQFYICCDNCQDWFHGRCVGILQSEADNIDEYVCPRCQKNSSVNYVNMKELSQKDFDNLKKLIKLLQSHKSSWPFMEPVDPTEAPDYYKVIKEPMDLQMIENKINDKVYQKLSEFIGDMTKIFDNCRYYNPKESPFFKCAESLEAYFVHRIKCFRDKLYENVK